MYLLPHIGFMVYKHGNTRDQKFNTWPPLILQSGWVQGNRTYNSEAEKKTILGLVEQMDNRMTKQRKEI
jgi:hypothetical protein